MFYFVSPTHNHSWASQVPVILVDKQHSEMGSSVLLLVSCPYINAQTEK